MTDDLIQTPNTETEQSTEAVTTSEVAKECLTAIETYRRGERRSSDRASTTRKLVVALSAAMPEFSDTEFDDSLGTYLSMLKQHDQFMEHQHNEEDSREPEAEEGATARTKRAASPGSPNEPQKKQKQDDSDFPWVVREQLSEFPADVVVFLHKVLA
jgi:hypothetical protein